MLKLINFKQPTLIDYGYAETIPAPHEATGSILVDEADIDYQEDGSPYSHYKLDHGRYVQDVEATAIATNLQEVAQAEAIVKAYVQIPIDNYNEATGTNFESVYNCTTYKDVETYPHKTMCQQAVNWNAEVWDASRQLQINIATGVTPKPETEEEFVAHLPTIPTFG